MYFRLLKSFQAANFIMGFTNCKSNIRLTVKLRIWLDGFHNGGSGFWDRNFIIGCIGLIAVSLSIVSFNIQNVSYMTG